MLINLTSTLTVLQWETSLNQLGELEFLVKESLGDESVPVSKDQNTHSSNRRS